MIPKLNFNQFFFKNSTLYKY